jgi:hypothetical protein
MIFIFANYTMKRDFVHLDKNNFLALQLKGD